MGEMQKWGSYPLEELAKEENIIQGNSTKVTYMKLVEGKNIVRVLPPKVAGVSPWKIVSEHYVELPGGAYSFACPREMKVGRCPVCDHAFELMRMDNEEDKKRGKELLPRMRFYINVINRKDPEKGPVVLAATKTIYNDFKAIRRDSDAGGDFTDPTDSGFDVTIEREGQRLNTKYKAFPHRSSSPLRDDGNYDEWISKQVDLNIFASNVPTAEEIEARIAAAKPEEIRAEVIKESPKAKTKAKRPKLDEFEGDDDLFGDDDISF